MDFKEVESKYFELKGRLESGALTAEQFLAQVRELRVQDDQGRYWAIDAPSGNWLCYDGSNWVPAQAPAGVSPLAPPARIPAPGRRGGPMLLVALVAVAVVMCLVALGGGLLVLSRPDGDGEEAAETAAISRDEAERIADDIITEEFPDLEGAARTTESYQNPAGTDFWTVTYRQDVEAQAGGETYTIPRVVIVSVNKDTGESEVAVSD